jgi:hypothetical protein
MRRRLRRLLLWYGRLWMRSQRSKAREFALTMAEIWLVFTLSYLGLRMIGGNAGLAAGAGAAFLMLAPLIFMAYRYINRRSRRRARSGVAR